MKFTLSWLKQHLDTDASLEEICERLTSLGLEVDGVEDRGAALAAFTIAEIVEAEQHPNADKLRCLKVNTGDEIVDVVCGAPNAAKGLKGVFARPGVYVPGIDFTLKKGVIRGEASNGMMCSEREMMLSDEHDGIIDLGPEAPVGASFVEYAGLDDPIIEIGLTPDRGDCAGVRGIARDLAASGMGTLKALDVKAVEGTFDSPIKVKFDLEGNEKACPKFLGRYIKGVKNGPSPKWLQDRLTAIGLRPISILVDITNLFSFDLARPLHVFDADKIQGDLSVRLSKDGESFDALNDKSYTTDDDMCVIADDSGVLGLAGVVGGETTGCSDETQNVFLEVALFDPIRTAMTGRKLQVNSDARYRFERGVDPEFVEDAMELATQMILDLCGGEAVSNVEMAAIADGEPEWSPKLTLRPSRVANLGGAEVAVEEQIRILEALGFVVEKIEDDLLSCVVPSWRPDVEGEADLVEEVLRVNGLDNIPSVSLPKVSSLTTPAVNAAQLRPMKVRRALASRGLNESITWSFMQSKVADMFGGVADELKLLNPISADLDVMRPSVLPNLLQAAARNADKGVANACLFEVGPAFVDATEKGQLMVAAGVRVGQAVDRHWAQTARAVDAYDAKADAIAAIEAAGGPAAPQITADAPSYYHPGRSATLRLGKNILGYFGELHPTVIEELGLKTGAVGFEVFLDRLPMPKKKGTSRPLLKLSPFQSVNRDFAFVMDADVPVEKMLRAAKGADKKLISDAIIFDVYQGKGVEEGKKSVALNITLQPMDKTLTDEEIEAVSKKLVASVEKTTGGQLRG